MNEFNNTPIISPEGKPGPAGWLAVWIKAVTRPSEQTFVEISEHPDALPKTAYIWVFLVGTLSGIVTGVIQGILLATGLGNSQFGSASGASVGGALIGAICASPIAGGLSVLFFALWVAVIQWIAKLFGGKGSYDKLVYAAAAISVPVSLISMLLVPFNSVPYLNICTGLLSFGVSMYALFLQITAVKAVNRFGWGQAAGSVLLPALAVGLLCGCLVFLTFMALGPVLSNVFSGINQSLQFAP